MEVDQALLAGELAGAQANAKRDAKQQLADARKARDAWDEGTDELQKAHNDWEEEKLAGERKLNKLTAEMIELTAALAKAE